MSTIKLSIFSCISSKNEVDYIAVKPGLREWMMKQPDYTFTSDVDVPAMSEAVIADQATEKLDKELKELNKKVADKQAQLDRMGD